jgi:hypothetical protein
MIPFDFKEIHIGSLVEKRVAETGLKIHRISNFMNATEEEVEQMYRQKKLPTDALLKFSKLLEYDFFRLYSHHLILYAPCGKMIAHTNEKKNISLPVFRKSVYTKEIIDFVLELEATGKKTRNQIIKEYRIPKTTLLKWIAKYRNNN